MKKDHRPAPYNIDAEQAVLASCMIDPTALARVSFLTKEHFSRDSHQWLFEALLLLSAEGAESDPITVGDKLEAMGRFEKFGGYAALSKISLATPTAIHAEHYARIVEACAIRRRMIDAAERIAKLAYNPDPDQSLEELLTEAESIVFEVRQERIAETDPVSIRDLGQEAMERYMGIALEQKRPGIPTGSRLLNDLIGGWRPSYLYLLAARPSMGKSSRMFHDALAAVEQGKRVLIFSLEMDRHTAYDRIVANLAEVDLQHLNTGPISGDELDRISQAIERITYHDRGKVVARASAGMGELIIHDQRGLSALQMQATLQRVMLQHGDVDLVFIDHIQEVRSSSPRRQQARAEMVGDEVRSIRNLAGRFGVPIVLLCQLNRECEKRPDKRPMLSDLKDTGSLEETADVIMFLYRDEYYNPNTETPGVTEMIVSKQRNGPTGLIDQHFRKDTGRWGDLERFEPSDFEETAAESGWGAEW